MLGVDVEAIVAPTECESGGSNEISHPVMPMAAIADIVKVWIPCFMLMFVSKNDVECSEGL
jgi:hypothetical protein